VRTHDDDQELVLSALGFGGSSESETHGKVTGSWFGRTALLSALACLIIVGLIGVYFMGRVMVFPQVSDGGGTPKGDCFVLDQSECVSLTVQFAQKLAGFPFPPGAEVITSHASKSLDTGSEEATVLWPEGSPIPERPKWVNAAPEGVKSDDFAMVDSTWRMQNGQYRTQARLGMGTDGRPRLEVSRHWYG